MSQTQAAAGVAPRRDAPAPNVPVIDFDIYSDEVLTNPYGYYEQLREAGPLVWLSQYQVYAAARHEPVTKVLTDPQVYCSSGGVGLTNFHTEKPWRVPSIILEADPPEHSRTRKIFVRILSPRALNKLRDRFEREAEAMVLRLIQKGEFDGGTELAAAYPLKVFADAVGVPAEGRHHLLAYGDMVFNAFGPRNERFQQCLARLGPSIEWITNSCKRENLTPDGFGAELYAAADAGEITHDEAALLVRTTLSAGLDTTIFTLSNALACFAKYPDQWKILAENPALARQAIEEVLRYEPTFHTFYRTTTRPTVLEGVPLEAEQKVLVAVASANRDPRHWANADTFDVTRKASSNMAFGTGIHGCAGQMIARLEGEIVMKTLATHVAKIELTGEPKLHFNNTVRGYSSLPLRVTSQPH